jgi:hypothetical protein
MSRDRAFGVLGGFLRHFELDTATRVPAERTEDMVMAALQCFIYCLGLCNAKLLLTRLGMQDVSDPRSWGHRDGRLEWHDKQVAARAHVDVLWFFARFVANKLSDRCGLIAPPGKNYHSRCVNSRCCENLLSCHSKDSATVSSSMVH